MRQFLAVMLGIAVTTSAIPVAAQPAFLPFVRRVEANPDKQYPLSVDHGPWMIMAASFAGPEATKHAHALAVEIRRELRMPAYVYAHRVDYEDRVGGLGLDLNPVDPGLQPVQPQMRHLNLRDFEEMAVFVGDWPAIDDPKAAKALETIKNYAPKTMGAAGAEASFRQQAIKRHFAGLAADKPLRSAFLCPNPMLPEDFFNPNGPDRFVYELNKDLEFSLLHNRGKYSLKVATFRGESSFDLREIERQQKEFSLKALLGQPVESKLDDCEFKAHQLTLALRERGIEAYEYHDRTSSYVCVGSFQELFITNEYGLKVPHPDLQYWVKQFEPIPIQGVIRNDEGRTVSGALRPFTLQGLEDIPFDYSAEPIEVPRYNIANDYRGSNRLR